MAISGIRVMGITIMAILLLIGLTGCTSNYKDFKVSDVGEDEGVVIGKVNVVYNNNPYNTDLCKFCIGSTCHELLKEGYVFITLRRDEDHSAVSLFCHYIGGQGDRMHTFKISPLKVKPGVTYIGNLLFSTKEVSSDQLELGMVLAKKDNTDGRYMFGIAGVLLLPEGKPVQVVGSILSIEDEMSAVLNAYQHQVGNDSGTIEKSIVTVEAQTVM